MIFCLAVFRSRMQTMEFVDYMQSHGIDCRVVNTPSEAHIGCGISAMFPIANINYAKNVIQGLNLTAFGGFYEIRKNGFSTSVRRL